MTTSQLAGSVAFLRANLARIVEDPTFPVEDFAREIRDCRKALDRHDEDRAVEGASRINCPAPHPDADGRLCSWRIALTIGDASAVVVCPQCNSHWTAGRLILVGLSDPAVTIWAYPDVIATVVGIDPSTLRKWHERGHIDRLGSRYNVGQAYRRKRDAA